MLVDCGSCADAEQMLNAEEERMRTENNRFLLFADAERNV